MDKPKLNRRFVAAAQGAALPLGCLALGAYQDNQSSMLLMSFSAAVIGGVSTAFNMAELKLYKNSIKEYEETTEQSVEEALADLEGADEKAPDFAVKNSLWVFANAVKREYLKSQAYFTNSKIKTATSGAAMALSLAVMFGSANAYSEDSKMHDTKINTQHQSDEKTIRPIVDL